ncbi:hypothetical protein WH91_03195 [Devosia psychrophila]|uniref:WYL domain-containing protein n=1 Tax=Devosia psychrophila TaxID=728005 RepID=A0ABR5E2D7_9HYPH|nr:WYL domain-containing protein [Devosia psychrophila]KKC34374.1 hypothetical protein WH91_03195 [Devosia psychrophila]
MYGDNDRLANFCRADEVQFLYYKLPVWYVLAWDRMRDGVRFFRIYRIRHFSFEAAKFQLGRPAAFLSAGETDVKPL